MIVAVTVIIVAVMLAIYPIPVLMLDILISLNIIFTLVILIAGCCSGKRNSSLYTKTLLLSAISIFLINIASARLILAKGADFDGVLIRFISDFVNSHGIGVLIAGFFIFLTLTAVQCLLISIDKEWVAEKVTTRFDLATLLRKFMAINVEHDSEAISDEESLSQKQALMRECVFYDTYRFISINVFAGIVIFIVIILGGILVNVNIHFEVNSDSISIIIPRVTTIEQAKIYFSLAIGNGLLLLFPVLLQFITIRIILEHKTIKKEENKQS